jgi:hypothetical protein
MEVKIDSNQKKAEADTEEMLVKLKEEMKANQGDLLARMDHQTKYLLSHINQSTQNLPETAKIHPGMMQSVEGNQDTPTEDAAVMPVGKPGTGVGSKSWRRSAARSRRKGPKDIAYHGKG